MKSKFMRPGKIHNINLLTPDGRKNVNIYIVKQTYLCIHCLHPLKLHNAGVKCEANEYHYGYIHRDEAKSTTQEARFMKIGKMFPSDYLRGIDIDKPVIVTIKSVTAERVKNHETNKMNDEFIMRFEELDKKLRLNLTMAKACALVLGDEEGDTDNWIGRRVTIYRDTVKSFGKEYIVPRIREIKSGDVDLGKAIKAAQNNGNGKAQNGNGQEEKPAFATIKALLSQINKDFGLSEDDAKGLLKELGFTGFTSSASGKMYQAVKDKLTKPVVDQETGEVQDELGFADDSNFNPATTPHFAEPAEAN